MLITLDPRELRRSDRKGFFARLLNVELAGTPIAPCRAT